MLKQQLLEQFPVVNNNPTNKSNMLCKPNQMKLCGKEECQLCFERSFATHEKSQYWSDKNKFKAIQVRKNSDEKYLFDCLCGHEFESSLSKISGNRWCPYCAKTPQKLCDNANCQQCFDKSFASSDKAQYWSSKNLKSSREIFKSTPSKYFFDCLCGHTFESVLSNISKGIWCSYCGNKSLCDNNDCQQCFDKSFASSEKAQFFNVIKNKTHPRKVFKYNNNKFYFNCLCGHEFESSLNGISNGHWCSYCSNPPQKLCDKNDCQQCFEKSFASHDKVQFWNKQNKDLPRNVFKSSGNKYIFDCSCGHEFESSLSHISNGGFCPYCSNPPKNLCANENCQQCFEKSFVSHDKVQFWSKKNNELPRNVFRSSDNKYIFDCSCGHEFESELYNIFNGRWCPYWGHQKLCDNKDCQQCFEKSFASNDKVKFWSKKNKDLPRNVFRNSNNKYIFDCSCGHEFESVLSHISKGGFCPYCAIPSKILCDKADCQQCFEKSFASHDKVKFWSKKNKDLPRNVFRNSNNKYIFDCSCGHEFEKNLSNISDDKLCPYCAIPSKILCDKIDCQQCFEKSFASSEKVQFFNIVKNGINQRNVFKSSSSNKYFFNCGNGHEFKSALSDISSGRWCPRCKNKTEKKLYDWLYKNYLKVDAEKNFDWCKNPITGKYLPFDNFLSEYNIIIELDGLQHFKQVSNWQSPEYALKRDIYKMNLALKEGITIIRLLQDDVFNDAIDWQNKLKSAIKKYTISEVIYLENGKTYELHQQEMNTLLENMADEPFLDECDEE